VSAKAVIRDLLRAESAQERITLLLTSHDTGDMESVCERVIVMHHGRLLWDGSLESLRRGYLKRKRVTLWTEADHLDLALPGVHVVSSRLHRTDLEIAFDTTPLGSVVDAAAKQTLIRDMAIEDPPLDEVIRALYTNAEGRTTTP
jgi:ABC-2 type transport system ATP-binding protein